MILKYFFGWFVGDYWLRFLCMWMSFFLNNKNIDLKCIRYCKYYVGGSVIFVLDEFVIIFLFRWVVIYNYFVMEVMGGDVLVSSFVLGMWVVFGKLCELVFMFGWWIVLCCGWVLFGGFFGFFFLFLKFYLWWLLILLSVIYLKFFDDD